MLGNFPRSHSKGMAELGLTPLCIWSQAHVCLSPMCFPPESLLILTWALGQGRGSGREDRSHRERDSRVGKHLLLSAISPGQILSSRSQPCNLQSQPGIFQTSVPCTQGGHRNVDSKAQPGRKCTSLGTTIKEAF